MRYKKLLFYFEYLKDFQQFVEKSSVWRKLEENQDFWRHTHDFFGDSQSITSDSKTLSFMLNYLVVSSYNTGSCWRTQLLKDREIVQIDHVCSGIMFLRVCAFGDF